MLATLLRYLMILLRSPHLLKLPSPPSVSAAITTAAAPKNRIPAKVSLEMSLPAWLPVLPC